MRSVVRGAGLVHREFHLEKGGLKPMGDPTSENGGGDVAHAATLAPENRRVPEPQGTERETGEREELKLVASRIAEMTSVLGKVCRVSEETERVIASLHGENQTLRAGEMRDALMPVWRDLVRLYDDLQQTLDIYKTAGELRCAEVTQDWQLYRDSVADLLYRQGVDRCEATHGDIFDPKQHRAVVAIPTGDPAHDRRIARVVRVGFRVGERIVRPIETEVYRLVSEDERTKNDSL
jgi:molecular chaperone GrpE (heat shock protein)